MSLKNFSELFADLDSNNSNNAKIELLKNYLNGMLDQGIYLPPSAFESYFLNDAITFSDINYTVEAFRKVISKF